MVENQYDFIYGRYYMSNDSKDELTLRIGEKLTAARIESGYTQSCAARAVGTSQSCISAVEHGKSRTSISSLLL